MWHHAVSGVFFTIAMMLLADGGITAAENKNETAQISANETRWYFVKQPYLFVDVLPLLLCIIGMILMAMTDMMKLTSDSSGGDGDYMGISGGSSSGGGENTAKALFFISCFLHLAGFAVGIYRAVANNAYAHAYPGRAEIFCTIIVMISTGFLAVGNYRVAQAAAGSSNFMS